MGRLERVKNSAERVILAIFFTIFSGSHLIKVHEIP